MRLRAALGAAMLRAMTMRAQHWLLAAGGVLVLVGLILGGMPVTSAGVECGSALGGPAPGALRGDLLLGSTCEAAREVRQWLAWGLMVPGLILAAVGAVVAWNARVDAEWAATR